MFVVNFAGGLGNQMFQYAFGEALSHICDKKVSYCVDFYDDRILHNGFELDKVFDLQLEIVPENSLLTLLPTFYHYPLLRRLLGKVELMKYFTPRAMVIERSLLFDSNVLKAARDGDYFQGYWQSEKYFLPIEQSLRNAYSFKCANELGLDQIPGVKNISLHVRRGDYLNAGSVHSISDISYYSRAIDFFRKKESKFRLVVFSDDIDWAREMISPLHKEFLLIQGNRGADSYKDMYLMSLCQHHIIANSTFSWWGAWLSASDDKIVIAPRNWFNTTSLDSGDIIPTNWKVL